MLNYNVKVIKYPNGEIILRRYSEFLKKEDTNFYEDADVLDDDYFLPDKSKDKVRNPFDNKIVYEVDNFEELEKKRIDNEYRSYNRTRQKIYDYSRCCSWEWFLTFTFSPDVINRYSYDACSKVIRKWLNNQKRNAPDLKYLVVPEQHKDGAYHFHGLFADTGRIKFSDSGHKTKDGDIIYNLSKWSYGFTTATKIKDIYKSSKYLCKYVTKDLCDLTKGKHRYFVSSNISNPETYLYLVEDDIDLKDLQEHICDSFGVGLQYVSTPRYDGAFMNVDYYSYS